jgi:hypothetical protein
MRSFFSLLLLFTFFSAHGQDKYADSVKMGDTINIQQLLGRWGAFGTNRPMIEFRYEKKELKLVAAKDAVYSFFLRDTVFTNPLQGVLIKWPPDDCTIRVINNSLIEINYVNFGSAGVMIRYRRRSGF